MGRLLPRPWTVRQQAWFRCPIVGLRPTGVASSVPTPKR